MPRTRPPRPATDLLNWIGRLPWWVGVLGAVLSYLLLSKLAARPVGVTVVSGHVPQLLASGIVKGAASVGQYILPLIFLAGAVLSIISKRQGQGLLNQAQQGAASAINDMDWKQFEALVGEAYRRQGYQVAHTGGASADGGVDLVLTRPRDDGQEKTLVQCKHWRALKVGVDVVRELYGVMAARGAAAGVVVTSGQFTAEAQAFAQGRNIRLMDGPALRRLIESARGTAATRNPPTRTPQAVPGTAPTQPSASPPASATPSPSTPPCPHCGKPMVKRTAQKGANAGSQFWGCSGFPACRGTRPLVAR